MPNASAKLGIIAGGGSAPRHLIAACQKLGRDFFVVCLEGQADKDLAAGLPHMWLHLGAWSKLKAAAKEQAISEAVLIGRVRKPAISELRPDWLGVKVLAKIGLSLLGEDVLLRAVGKAIEDEIGLHLIGAQDVSADLLTPVGLLGKIAPDDVARKDMALGVNASRQLGERDIGQSVIVQQGTLLGEEGADGTDALITCSSSKRLPGPGGVLVKMAKPQQDDRFDLPTIGPETIAALEKAGLRGVALEAGRSLLLDREETIAQADQAGIFVYGLSKMDISNA